MVDFAVEVLGEHPLNTGHIEDPDCLTIAVPKASWVTSRNLVFTTDGQSTREDR